MRGKTSTPLSTNPLAKVDLVAGSKLSWSTAIERVLRLLFRVSKLGKIHARDLTRINAAAARLNSEAEDVLAYQTLNR
jgi:hypothetical protein